MWNILVLIFNTILYQPLLNGLILLYEYIPGHDFGIAVIILTLIIRLLLYPSSIHGVRSQRALTNLQPKIKEIQEKYKDNKEEQMKLLMELYKKEKVNPFSSCLPLLLQLPILIAMYQVFLRGLHPESLNQSLYSFVSHPGMINFSFLGIINLTESNMFLALLAGVLQFYQLKTSTTQATAKGGEERSSSTAPKEIIKGKTTDFSKMMQSQMLYLFPVLTVYIIWQFGSIIGLYWTVSILFSIGEQYIVKKKYA
jgi:YidC/Oxa1 family membrane protein insertase